MTGSAPLGQHYFCSTSSLKTPRAGLSASEGTLWMTLNCSVDTPERWNANQRDIDRFEDWDQVNQIQQWQVQSYAAATVQPPVSIQTGVGGEWIESSLEERGLGVLVDKKHNLGQKWALAAQKPLVFWDCSGPGWMQL